MLLITQNPLRDLALMGKEFITQHLIVPFEDDELARNVAANIGLPLDDYPEFAEYFLAATPPGQMRDPIAFDHDTHPGGTTDRGELEGRAFLVDEFRRRGPIRIAAEPDPRLHHAYDTTPAQDHS